MSFRENIKKRGGYPSSHKRPAVKIRHRLLLRGGVSLCGYALAFGAEGVADTAPVSHELWRFALSVTLLLCGKPVVYKP